MVVRLCVVLNNVRHLYVFKYELGGEQCRFSSLQFLFFQVGQILYICTVEQLV